MNNKYCILTLLIAGLNFNTQTMENNDRTAINNEVETSLGNIYSALHEYGLTSSEQNNLMNAYPSLSIAQSTSAILLKLTLKNLSTKQAIDLMSGVYNRKAITILLKSTIK